MVTGLRAHSAVGLGLIPGAAVGDLAADGEEATLQRHVGRRVEETYGVFVDDLDTAQGRPQAAGERRERRLEAPCRSWA